MPDPISSFLGGWLGAISRWYPGLLETPKVLPDVNVINRLRNQYIRGAVRLNLSANRALEGLRSIGLGMRRQTFLERFRAERNEYMVETVLRPAAPEDVIGKEFVESHGFSIPEEDWLTPKAYRYRAVIVLENDAGERIEVQSSYMYADNPHRVADILEAAQSEVARWFQVTSPVAGRLLSDGGWQVADSWVSEIKHHAGSEF